MGDNNYLLMDTDNMTRDLFGNLDKNIKLIEKEFNIDIVIRDGQIKLIGDKEKILSARTILEELNKILEKGDELTDQKLKYLIELIKSGDINGVKKTGNFNMVLISANGKPIKPKTLGQKNYLESIEKNDLVFGLGPAGTGKTFLAVLMAAKAFKNEEVDRIILVRPAVEAGESLGFLPGDLKDKVDPYLRPLYDSLFNIMGPDKFSKLEEKGVIEVAPLAYMRGRTLDNAFIILDEAQNTTIAQMKMFLTRLGYNSKAVVNGDLSQIDLPKGKTSGLTHARKILKDIDGIDFFNLTKKDIVRHELVQKIISAYEES